MKTEDYIVLLQTIADYQVVGLSHQNLLVVRAGATVQQVPNLHTPVCHPDTSEKDIFQNLTG